MTIAGRAGMAGAFFAVLIALGARPSAGQDSPPSKEAGKAAAPAAKRAYDPARRVPAYFGQIGLTPEQKESIYKIRAKHHQQVEALERQIAQIQSQMLAECEAVLTETQMQLLENRRRAAGDAQKKGDTARPSRESSTPASRGN
jgi:hypothetical protein